MLLNNTGSIQGGKGTRERSLQATRKLLLNPKTESYNHLDEPSRKLVRKTIDFFENKGKAKLKEDDHERVWYSDFLEFSKKENFTPGNKTFSIFSPSRNTEQATAAGIPAEIVRSMKSSAFMA